MPSRPLEKATLVTGLLAAVGLALASGVAGQSPEPHESVFLHRLFHQPFMCAEHFGTDGWGLGDALGTDCVVQGRVMRGGQGFLAPFRTDGVLNEDWFGWRAEVLAPFDGTVAEVQDNPVVNVPGAVGRPPAGIVSFQRSDGLTVVFAHVQEVQVSAGQTVRAGQVVARVGNNGPSRNPHIHVGAWNGSTPHQIRWDLRSGPDRF